MPTATGAGALSGPQALRRYLAPMAAPSSLGRSVRCVPPLARDVAHAIALILEDPESLPVSLPAVGLRLGEDLGPRRDVEIEAPGTTGAGRAEEQRERILRQVGVKLGGAAVHSGA